MRNVEIKAKVRNLKRLIENVQTLANAEPITIPQCDTFFNVPNGRLKLRQFESGAAELIFYDRPDKEGPKLSSYKKCDLDAACVKGLTEVLTESLGFCGKVKKTRQLFMVGQTRVHIDAVDELGDFMELEVALKDDETEESGEQIAKDLMQKFEIEEDDLMACAYTDLLNTYDIV